MIAIAGGILLAWFAWTLLCALFSLLHMVATTSNTYTPATAVPAVKLPLSHPKTEAEYYSMFKPVDTTNDIR